ncbi:methionyl-tRNA formyltransferase [Algoriphagus sp. PAP.12]|uniref:methionyl-tRNA formyltransferase n=1 Tax=Algoriphagus sp. PAP.12 TaxID=2996678 RepID=UPI00227A18A9|nr:formyltransferase family protein [Algoriphagus sp. PAP.12]
MKLLFFSQSNWSIPSISELAKSHEILGVVTFLKGERSNPFLLSFLEKRNIKALSWEDVKSSLNDDELANSDLGISFGFSSKIPKEIYAKISKGVLNVHFGKLPKYAGPAPLFWTIKNMEKSLSISFHIINEDWDAGELLLEEELPIFPGEPFGLLGSRASLLSSQKLDNLLRTFEGNVPEILEVNFTPLKRPSDIDLTIDWKKQSADEIEALINASNPAYGGAISSFRGSPIRILEVSPAEANINGIFAPGSVVYSDPQYGIFVICGDNKHLRINILQLEGTVLSGQKLAALGVRVYEKFE